MTEPRKSPVKWRLETRRLLDLKSHPKNPRSLSKHDAQHLQKSLERFGVADKPIINTDNLVIGGHQRITILKRMGHKEVECWVPDEALTQKEVDELNIRLNKNTGDFDYEILANEWDMQDLVDWGFDEKDLDLCIDEIEDEEEDKKKDEEKTKLCPHCGKEL